MQVPKKSFSVNVSILEDDIHPKSSQTYCLQADRQLLQVQLWLQDWLINRSRPHELSQTCGQMRNAIVWVDGTGCLWASVSVLLTTWSAGEVGRAPSDNLHNNNEN